MDRNFWYQQAARERQVEISRELANRHLLHESGRSPLGARQVMRIALRVSPVAIALSILVLFRLFGS